MEKDQGRFKDLMFRQLRESFRNRQKHSGVLRELAHKTLASWKPTLVPGQLKRVRLVEGPMDGAIVEVSSSDPLLIGFLYRTHWTGNLHEWEVATNPTAAAQCERWVAYASSGDEHVYRFIDSGAI